MSTFDIIVAGIFACVVFVAGLSFSKIGSQKGTQSFFSGSGIVPWWVSGISLYMSFFSVGTFVVWGSIAYSDGFVSIAIQSAMCLAGVIIGFFIASKWNDTNVMTAAEFIGDRLGPKTKTIYTTLFLLSSMIGMGGWLYPVGRIVEVSTGIPLSTAILILAAFILIYSIVGGLWAVLVTDFLQFVVLSAAIIIVVPLAFGQIGGVSQFFEQAPDRFFSLTNSEYTWGFLLAFVIYNTVFIGGHWGYVQRYTSVSNTENARKVAWLFAGLYFVSPIIWMLPPMIYQIMEPGLQGFENEGAYMLVSKAVLPSGLLGLMLSAMVFATASSVNTVLNISSAVFTNDVYAVVKKNTSEKHLLNVARISTAVLGISAVLSAFMVQYFGGIVNMVLAISAIVGGSLFMPPLWALFSRRQTAFSILTVTFLSLTANIALNFITPDLIGLSLDRASQMLFGVFFPLSLLLGFELLFILKGKEDPRIAFYDERRSKLAEQRQTTIREAIEDKMDTQSISIITYSVTVVGLLIASLGLFSGDAAWVVCLVGIIIMGLALWFNPKVRQRFLSTK